MSNLDLRMAKETFARLFVMAVQNEINFLAFTASLERSAFANLIEEDVYDDYFNTPLTRLFFDITKMHIEKDESFGIYNDAYWCGYSYFELQQRLKKPFSYLFLKLPLSKMMDIYPVFHEMDFSALLGFFEREKDKKTILRALCEQRRCSLSKLSASTGISQATLSKYNADDEALLKGSFQNVYKISKYFNTPVSLFSRNTD
ncbi:MAG: helix-turn-helix transcriptional regulator [Bacilli bacterium]|nr:helix-turn-helix transcriptional regulator [Bacilli bacterium]